MQESLKQIRLELHRYMHKHFGISVVWSDRVSTVPSKPYTTIKVTNISPEQQNTMETFDWSDDKENKYSHRFYRVTLSINVYQKDDQNEINMDSLKISHEIRRWFEVYAELLFERLDVVVTEVGNITDRTTFLVDSYDYKRGFDVTLRLTQKDKLVKLYQDDTSYNYDIIETVEVTNERSGETTIINGGGK